MNKVKYYFIEALPIHGEICSYLIDNRITFHCYNGGLKAIQISIIQPYNRNFIDDLMNNFDLYEVKRVHDRIELKSTKVEFDRIYNECEATPIEDFDVYGFIDYCENLYGMTTEEFKNYFKENGFDGNVDMQLWYQYIK